MALALKKSGRLTEANLLNMLKEVSIYRSEFKSFEAFEELLVEIEKRINVEYDLPYGQFFIKTSVGKLKRSCTRAK